MKKFFVLSLILVLAVGISGCRKKSKPLPAQVESTIGYHDVPLTEYSLEDFTIPPDDLKETVFKTVYFDYNKYDIKPSEEYKLNSIADWLKDHPNKHLLIEGHCDERGSSEYNYALGEQRALSVRRYLINLGIEPERLHTKSYGEDRPVAFGHNEDAWSKNRRAEFLISK